jgi:transcriptional regulator with XRE-family HTH domain
MSRKRRRRPAGIDPGPGRRLAAARRAAGLTQDELAGRCGCDRSWISAIERGARPAHLETIDQIARALGADPHAIDPRLAPRAGG